MCQNKKCTLKDKCYRFTAKHAEYQTYTKFEQCSNGECDYFWDNHDQGKTMTKDEYT